MAGLLSRIRPDLVPPRPPAARVQRPGPRDRVLDQRPEWVRRMQDEGRVPQGVPAR